MARLVSILGLLWLAGCHAILGYDELQLLPQADKVDVLLVIDNSRGTIMADKQALFEIAVDTLMQRLLARSDDVQVGIVTTSLGSLGGDTCDEESNDHARLVARAVSGEPLPSYRDIGFLKWDPPQRYDPPGLADPLELRARLRSMVLGTGQRGCGFEQPLESMYRFLAQPDPYERIVIDGDGQAQHEGVDATLLSQRAAFVRPDSLLVVVLLTDENDCSLRTGGQYWLATQLHKPGTSEPYHLHPGRAACAIDPMHACCTSCELDPVAGCDDSADMCGEELPEEDDHLNLRCFQPKRRFGIDFLQPIDRYVAALSSAQIADRQGAIHDNPLFAGGRHPWQLLVAGIVGVPWHDIARRTAAGQPDLVLGLDRAGRAVGGLMTARELRDTGSWELILGEPSLYFHEPEPRLPRDPVMIESIEPRSGDHPLLGVPLAPPDAGPLANPINGHEHSNAMRDDLQYACIIRLAEPRDCTIETDCQCIELGDSPLCQHPETGEQSTTQHFASAYPGIRHLELLRALGDQAVVGSICPAQGVNPEAPGGYQPTVDALLEAIEPRLE